MLYVMHQSLFDLPRYASCAACVLIIHKFDAVQDQAVQLKSANKQGCRSVHISVLMLLNQIPGGKCRDMSKQNETKQTVEY